MFMDPKELTLAEEKKHQQHYVEKLRKQKLQETKKLLFGEMVNKLEVLCISMIALLEY